MTEEEEQLGKLLVENKILRASKETHFYLLKELIKKLKKKTNCLDNALQIMDSEDQKIVEEIFREHGIKL